jgi:alpha-N-arabinofuranosidase
MEELITRHSGIMDQYDPQKRVGLMVDEWGAWYNVEPGTNPGFLFQQSTIRDALISAINLNIFNNHSDRVKMSNIAQMVNVLQSLIFTQDDKMVLTPTFYVYEMYKVHHDAALIPLQFTSPMFEANGKKNPVISASASRDKKGLTHVTFSNSDLTKDIELSIDVRGGQFTSVSGVILTGKEINAHNTFENPEVVKPTEFKGAKISGNTIHVKLPAKSVVMIELK